MTKSTLRAALLCAALSALTGCIGFIEFGDSGDGDTIVFRDGMQSNVTYTVETTNTVTTLEVE